MLHRKKEARKMVEIVVQKESLGKLIESVTVEQNGPGTVLLKIRSRGGVSSIFLVKSDAVAVRDALTEAIRGLK